MISNGNGRSPQLASGYRAMLELRTAAIMSCLRVGVQAALCAKAEVLEKCQPKTALGRVVQGLVLEAGKGRATALKTLLRFLNDDEVGEETEDARAMLTADWDWNADGVWLTIPDWQRNDAEATKEIPTGQQSRKNHASAPLNRHERRRLAALAREGAKEQAPQTPLANAA